MLQLTRMEKHTHFDKKINKLFIASEATETIDTHK